MRRFVQVLTGIVVAAALMPAEKPDRAAAAALLEKSRQISLEYAHSLPDFLCTEVISRYRMGNASDMRVSLGRGVTTGALAPLWLPLDKLSVSLSYFQGHEKHELKLLNGNPTDRKFGDIGG